MNETHMLADAGVWVFSNVEKNILFAVWSIEKNILFTV